jgi:ribonuclease HII
MSLKSSAKASRVSLYKFDSAFGVPVCGIDEVGRGPLAGPVVAACVHIPPEHVRHPVWRDVTDSKKLSAQKREFLFELITQRCLYSVAEASVEEIDSLNIHHATLLAMRRAYDAIHNKLPPLSPRKRGETTKDLIRGSEGGEFLALIDGKFAPELPCRTQTIIKGDATSLSIAAASILAKVTRDRMMAKLDKEFPYHGWAGNAGYGTPEHLNGIAKHGITPHHRRSFAPCR